MEYWDIFSQFQSVSRLPYSLKLKGGRKHHFITCRYNLMGKFRHVLSKQNWKTLRIMEEVMGKE